MALKKFKLRNMLSRSCVELVRMTLERIDGVAIKKISMGEVDLEVSQPKKVNDAMLEGVFGKLGFDVIHDGETEVVEKIKLAAVELIHFAFNTNSLIRNSDYISEKVQLPYDKISKLFSKHTNTTLEKYIILLKIEKAKELISNNEYTLSEISYMLGYSSVQYLSNQFKKITGITVSQFKDSPERFRIPIEDLL